MCNAVTVRIPESTEISPRLGVVAGNRKASDRRDGRKKKLDPSSARGPAAPPPPAAPRATAAWPRARVALVALATAYLVTVWFDGIRSGWPAKLLPRPWLYFAQIAALFKHAGIKAIDYRAEGWLCTEGRWEEIDVRPFFRIDRDNKENRFHRTLQFYRRERTVMRALDDYVVERHNATRPTAIGGVRFLSLRLPYPAPGERITPYERKPLTTYENDSEVRRDWYWTPASRRAACCGQPPRARSRERRGHAPNMSSASDVGHDGDLEAERAPHGRDPRDEDRESEEGP
jgi:hypothetical protein